MIKDLGSLIKQLKDKLPEYLESQGIKTQGKLFKCPNHQEHKNEDSKPSANFFPDKRSWHCFVCEYKEKLGDIFDAVKIIEGKDITGENFFEVIKYLCKKFKISYQEVHTDEEKFFKSIHIYLEGLVNTANKTLITNIESLPKVKTLLNEKQWFKSIDKFKLGYLKEPYITQVDKDILAFLNLNPKDIVSRIIIPLYNKHGQIVGITTRSLEIDKKSNAAKYMHYIGYNLKNIVYNLNNIDPNKEVTIVEGPSSVITLDGYGITNVVATFGNFMHPTQYEHLVKKKVKKGIFLYDGDIGGSEGLRNSLEVMCKNDIEMLIGFLKNELDPGDYINQHKTLKDVKKLKLYDYLAETYAANTSDKYIEKCLMIYINSIKDLVQQETIIGNISKLLKINKSTIQDLLHIYEKNSNSGSVSELMKERDSLLDVITGFEKWAWTRGQLLGLKSFKSFNMKLDGIQNGLILVGGRPNIGKSALLISMAMKMLQYNNSIYLLYFTIDDSMYTTLSRFIANLSDLPINVINNPNFKITKAEIPDEVKNDYINRRENAITFLRDKASIINLKDSEDGATIEQIKEKVKTIAPLTQGKQLVIMIDNLHNLRSQKYVSDRHLYSLISNELNTIANQYKCPLIASTHVTKEAIKNKNYDGTAIKETVELFYDAKLILIVDSDDDDLDGSRDDLELKVVVTKNKFSSYKGTIQMMFYRSSSKIEEENMKEHKEQDLFE